MDGQVPSHIAGYDYGKTGTAVSSVSDEELRQLEETAGWTEEDANLLRSYGDLFRRHAERMVDGWRAVIGAQPHLAYWFTNAEGKPDDEYKARVKRRFVQWVEDTATRPHDREWLNYQQEIGLRHTPAKKNASDQRQTPSLVPLRYLLGFVPVVSSIRQVLEREISDPGELSRVEAAWSRAVVLHVTLWARAYTLEGLW